MNQVKLEVIVMIDELDC